MNIDVSPAISRLSKTATLSVRAKGSYDSDGNHVPGAKVTSTIQAAVMEISPTEMRDLPEGIRDEASAVCWTMAKLENDNEVGFGGETYRVLKVSHRHNGNYHRGILGGIKS